MLRHNVSRCRTRSERAIATHVSCKSASNQNNQFITTATARERVRNAAIREQVT